MKTVFIFLSLIVIAFFVNAQNRLVIFSDEGEQFTLYLNGEQQNQEPAINVKSGELNSDSYRLKVVFNNKSIPELTKNIYFPEPNKEFTFAIAKNKKGQYNLRFIGEAAFTPNKETAKGNSNVKEVVYESPEKNDTQINKKPRNEVATQTTTTTTDVVTQTTGTANTETIGINMTVGEGGINVSVNDPNSKDGQFTMGVNIKDPNTSGSTTVTTTTTTTYNQSVTVTDNSSEKYDSNYKNPQQKPNSNQHQGNYQHKPHGNYNNNQQSNQPYVDGPCAYRTSDKEFQDICSSINSKSFEDSKMTLAKQITKANCFTAEQVKQIMKLFSFEASKLEYAKFAYDFVYDKYNYYKVNEAFDFESSISDLDKYLENR